MERLFLLPRIRRFLLKRHSSAALLLLASLAAAVAEAQPIRPPDPSTGVIAGRVATMVWPARYKVADTVPEFLPPDGCTAHLIPSTDLDAEETAPCGRWFRPLPAFYKVWIEGRDYVSPVPSLLRFSDAPFQGRGVLANLPVVPAGYVALERPEALPKNHALRLLSLNTEFLGSPQRAFDRRVRQPEQRAAMPPGKVVAGIFDRATGDAVALTKPMMLTAGSTIAVAPEPPAEGADVLVVLQRPVLGKRGDISVQLLYGNTNRAPDVFVPAVDIVFAVWYGVRSDAARLAVRSETLSLPDTSLVLRPGRVTTFRGKLRVPPKLSLQVIAPENAFEKMEVAVESYETSKEFRRMTVAEGRSQVIENLPAERLRVTLVADEWEFVDFVDLTDGADGEVTFTLEPLVVEGTVHWGRDPAAGEVAFEYVQNRRIRAKTDDAGRYRLLLWKPAVYTAYVTIATEATVSAFIDFVDVESSTTVDFHLPKNRITVQVTDARSGQPIPAATVIVGSIWESDARGETTLSHKYATDGSGQAIIPPLHPGRATITATATRYQPAEPIAIDMDATTTREVTIPLSRLEDLGDVRVVRDDGFAAAGAEACVFARHDLRVLWCGTSDDEGRLEISAPSGSILVVRHARAGSAARILDAPIEELRLPAAGAPLHVRTTSDDGQIVRFAFLSLWLDGVRLTGPAAAYASWTSTAATDSTGTWTGRNLPPLPLKVLATRKVSPAEISTGAYDSLAAVVGYPWRDGGIDLRPVGH